MKRRRIDGQRPSIDGPCPGHSRRRFLATLGVGGAAATAGCLNDVTGRVPFVGSEANPTPLPRGPRPSGTHRDVDLPVPESELTRGAPMDGILAITDPTFGPDWADTNDYLTDESLVVGVERDGLARAYPLKMLVWHEVVNDVFPDPGTARSDPDGDAGTPLLVTYCPLCASGVVAERTVDGAALTLGVSGLLWRDNTVMYDERTGSLWSQMLARSIRGELTGTTLGIYPSTVTTWGQWRGAHPDAEVLLPPPASNTVRGPVDLSYRRNPYLGYETSHRIGIGRGEGVDDRLHPKTMVVGVAHGGVARAYTLPAPARVDVVNDSVDGLPVVVALVGTTLVAYDRRVGGRTRTFERDGEVLVDGGSRWDPVSGRALDGPHGGEPLVPANDRSAMFWFAWADFYPGSEIYGQ